MTDSGTWCVHDTLIIDYIQDIIIRVLLSDLLSELSHYSAQTFPFLQETLISINDYYRPIILSINRIQTGAF